MRIQRNIAFEIEDINQAKRFEVKLMEREKKLTSFLNWIYVYLHFVLIYI